MGSRRIANSMETLKWLYTVVAAFALTEGGRTFILNERNEADFRFGWRLAVFLIFSTTVVRFVHGAIRHFDTTYKEAITTTGREERLPPHQPFLDFVGLFTEAFLFILMAFSQDDHPQFVVYYLLLILTDTLWLSVSGVPPKAPGPTPYANWLISNLFLVGMIPVLVLWRRDEVLVPTFIGLVAIHSVLDYIAPGNWQYYFPGVRRPWPVERIACILDKPFRDTEEHRVKLLILVERATLRGVAFTVLALGFAALGPVLLVNWLIGVVGRVTPIRAKWSDRK